MKSSKWIVLRECEIGRRSGRFTIKHDNKIDEIAAVKTYLLVIDSDFKISLEAIRLASENSITLFIVDRDRYTWLTHSYVEKNIDYVLNQYNIFRKSYLKKMFDKAVRENILRLNKRIGVDEYCEDICGIVSDIKGIDRKILSEIENYFKLFVVAECLDAIIRSGLTPYIPIYSFLPEDFEKMFHHIAVWYSILDIDEKVFLNHDLNNYSYKRSILKYLRERLNRELIDIYGNRRPLIQHIKSYIKSLASHVLNPLAQFNPFIAG